MNLNLKPHIKCVPLATELGISLIILTPVKILQRNLNRNTFVVWEIKRNVSVVCVCSAPNCCDTEKRSVSVTASFRRDFGHRVRPISRRLSISYGDIWKGEFTKTNHEPQTPWKQTSPKKFRQWMRTYWQGLSKIRRTGFNPVWTQVVATSSTRYDVVTFLTQCGKSASNFVAISSLVVKLLKKCRFR